MREFCAFIILVLLLPAIAKGERPQLVNSDVWISENRIIATDFQTISGTLEFDQPLYLAESALCPRAEEVRARKKRRNGRKQLQPTHPFFRIAHH